MCTFKVTVSRGHFWPSPNWDSNCDPHISGIWMVVIVSVSREILHPDRPQQKLSCFEIACSMGRGLCFFICSLLNVPNQTPSRPRAIKTSNTYRSLSLSSLCVAGKYIIFVASQTQTSLIDAHFKIILRRWTIRRHGNFLRFGGVMPLLLYLVFHTLSMSTRAHSYIGKNVHARVFCSVFRCTYLVSRI